MEEQPNQSGGTSPAESAASPAPNTNPAQPATPAAEPTPTTEATVVEEVSETIEPTSDPVSSDTASEPGKKKSKKGLIATLICLFAVLLIGGGAFAAVYIINNQPANIIASSIDHLFNAKQVEVNGSISLSLGDEIDYGIQSINLNIDNKAAGLSNTSTTTLNIDFTDGTSAPAVELGEVMLSDGVLYIEANGLEDFYNETFRDTLETILMNQMVYGYQTNTTTDCYAADDAEYCTEESSTTVTVDPAVEASASKTVEAILDQVGEIISTIDGQWIEISIDDVLNHELFASMPSDTRQTISDTYKCTVSVLNKFPSYSSEFSDLYNQNPFINMTSGQDSFYNISLDATNLTGYLNATPNTQFVKELSKCYESDTETTTATIDVEDVESALEYLPSVSAKFDGFISHQLSELKVSGQNDSYSMSSDLKFSYPNNINVTAPSDSRPIMELIEEIYQGLEETSQSLIDA